MREDIAFVPSALVGSDSAKAYIECDQFCQLWKVMVNGESKANHKSAFRHEFQPVSCID